MISRKLVLDLEDIKEILDLDLAELNTVDSASSGSSGGGNGEGQSTENKLELHVDGLVDTSERGAVYSRVLETGAVLDWVAR